MAAMTCGGVSYRQTPLPKLRTAQELSRRDSLSSSRTGDSGYNSEDVSQSPLEYGSLDQVPYTSATFTFDSSALFDVKEVASFKSKRLAGNTGSTLLHKRHKDILQEPTPLKVDITSNPTASVKLPKRSKLDWTSAFKTPIPEPESTPLPEPTSSRNEDVEQWIKDNLQPQIGPKERNSSIASLSSTGSCDMYSNTDDNSDDEDVPTQNLSTLSKATLKTIELIMRKIEVNLGYAAYMQCAGSNQASRSQGSTNTPSRGGRGNLQGSGGKRKSRFDENLPPDDPDEDGSSKRRRVSITTTTEDSETGPRFACPFYKHDPNRYRSRRTCPGPGWPTVHRMKEHLYRSHAQPIFCPRCYAIFDSDVEFSTHLRAHPCQISAPQPIEGIDRETLKSLRKRSPPLRLEEDKWRDTYRLLFPEVATADIPSPYYDTDSPTEESRRFRRELLERIRQELFATAEQEPGLVEQRLLRQVAGIIQRCENDLLSSFYPTPGQLQPSFPNSRRASAVVVPSEDYSHPQSPIFPPGSTRNPPITIFQPPQSEPMSPRSRHAYPAPPHLSEDNPILPVEHPLPAPVAWSDPLQFSSSDWIDWNAVFPPGPEGALSERTEPHPTLSTPVWT